MKKLLTLVIVAVVIGWGLASLFTNGGGVGYIVKDTLRREAEKDTRRKIADLQAKRIQAEKDGNEAEELRLRKEENILIKHLLRANSDE